MADSSKADKVSFARVSDWDAIDIVVTDDSFPNLLPNITQAGPEGPPCLNH